MHAIVEAIHAAPVKLSLTICGAGATVVSMLTEVEGCSQTLIQADTLYAKSATTHALDYNPQHVVSRAVAAQLAQSAHRRSLHHRSQQAAATSLSGRVCSSSAGHATAQSLGAAFQVIGVGATSAIRTNRARHGKDHAFVCIWAEEEEGAKQSSCDGKTHDEHVSNDSRNSIDSSSERDAMSNTAPLSQPHSSLRTASIQRKATSEAAVHHYYLELDKSWNRVRQEREVALLILHAIAEYTTRVAAVATTKDAMRPDSCSAHSLPASLPRLLFAPPKHDCTSFPTWTTRAERMIQLVLDKELDVVLWNRFGDMRASYTPYFPEEEENDVMSSDMTSWGCVKDASVSGRRSRNSNRNSSMWHGADGTNSREESRIPADAAAPMTDGPHIIRLLYPGSFNPLHWGHTELARAAVAVVTQRYRYRRCHHDEQQQQQQQPSHAHEDRVICYATTECEPVVSVTYEIACQIVDKGGLAAAEMAPRVAQFLARHERVAVTRTRLFVEKAQLFPRHGFVIGLDTARRVLDPRYYDPATEQGMVAALQAQIGARGCFFVVGGRLRQTQSTEAREGYGQGDEWEDLSALRVPAAVRDLFIALTERDFRVDISSTELRARMQSQQNCQE